jgi:hypothetical protein
MDSLERILAFGGKSESYSIDEKRNLAQQKNSLDAAMNLNLSPEKCVGIEDSEAGIEAILAARMYAIGIGDPVILHRAYIVYASTKDIRIDRL